ncbi:MAG: helix-turn-helix domain-containing protein [Verrucomicrobiaceae bacterium]|nr:helix-turn-helix domain-containing protein [Verrucomicrobiaceae bacterium]
MPKRDPLLVKLGRSLRRHRDAAGISQEKLAELADINRTYVSDIERGNRNPGIKNLARLAKALGITTAELCEGVDL